MWGINYGSSLLLPTVFDKSRTNILIKYLEGALEKREKKSQVKGQGAKSLA